MLACVEEALCQMLRKRAIDPSAYNVEQTLPPALSKENGTWLPGAHFWVLQGDADERTPDFIIVTDQPRIGIVQLRLLKAYLNKKQRVLIVTRHALTAQAIKTTHVVGSPCCMQSILWVNVLMDPQTHFYGSIHTKISMQELQSALGTPLTTSSLPKILRTDAVAVYMGFTVGDIIRIQREQDYYYRVVV